MQRAGSVILITFLLFIVIIIAASMFFLTSFYKSTRGWSEKYKDENVINNTTIVEEN